MIKEFRDFLFRGNIIDLAVAVVLGAAFGAIITSLVADIMTPLLGLLGIPDFSTWVITVGRRGDAHRRLPEHAHQLRAHRRGHLLRGGEAHARA